MITPEPPHLTPTNQSVINLSKFQEIMLKLLHIYRLVDCYKFFSQLEISY